MRPTCLHALLPLCNSQQYRCVASAGTCRIVDTGLPHAHGGAAPQARVDQCWLAVHCMCSANIPAALLWQHQQTCETSHCQCERAANCRRWGRHVPRWHTTTRAHVLCWLAPAAAAADGCCFVATLALPAAALTSAAHASADARLGLAAAAMALLPRRAASKALVLT